jgi:hypothetical protein
MNLPSQIKHKQVGKLTKADLRLLEGAHSIFDMVSETYRQLWKIVSRSLNKKVAAGFCGATLGCANTIQAPNRTCDACRAHMKAMRTTRYGQKAKPLTPYQFWVREQRQIHAAGMHSGRKAG